MEMTLSEAAEFIGVPQKRLYRAVKAGKLPASRRHQGSRWEYLITREDLEAFDRTTMRPVDQDGRPVATDQKTDRPTREATERPTDQPAHPPVELYLALVDRLQQAERRTVELELTLRQSQRLLAENAESITEKETLAREAQAKQDEIERLSSQLVASQEAEAKLRQAEEARKVETERLTAELETTRLQLQEAQKPSGLLSWLGIRKKRTSDTSNSSKAV